MSKNRKKNTPPRPPRGGGGARWPKFSVVDIDRSPDYRRPGLGHRLQHGAQGHREDRSTKIRSERGQPGPLAVHRRGGNRNRIRGRQSYSSASARCIRSNSPPWEERTISTGRHAQASSTRSRYALRMRCIHSSTVRSGLPTTPDSLNPSDVDALTSQVNGKPYSLMSPFPGIDSPPVSIQSWGGTNSKSTASRPPVSQNSSPPSNRTRTPIQRPVPAVQRSRRIRPERSFPPLRRISARP